MSASLKIARLNQSARYYRGDPGIFSFLGKAAKAIVSGVSGFIGGGPLGAVKGVVSSLAGSSASNAGSPSATPPILRSQFGTSIPMPRLDSVVARGAGVVTPAGAAGAGSTTAYFSASGRPRKKYKKINCLNPRALKRATTRLQRFGEFARAMGYSRPPKAIKGFRGFPKRKRRTTACK